MSLPHVVLVHGAWADERQFAARMGATTVEVPSSHVAMVSHPDDVVQLIESAAKEVPAGG
jgi:hypothetical protein